MKKPSKKQVAIIAVALGSSVVGTVVMLNPTDNSKDCICVKYTKGQPTELFACSKAIQDSVCKWLKEKPKVNPNINN